MGKSMLRRNRLLLATALAATLGTPAPGHGQVSGSWINLDNGSWSIGSNWSSNPLYPDGGGTASFGPTSWNSATVGHEQG
jgi:hypothetical protein